MNVISSTNIRHSPMLFISGRISLDLSHTGGKRTAQGAYFERLHLPQDLEHWLSSSDLALNTVTVDGDALLLAHELREAIWFAAHAVVNKEPIDQLDRGVINRFASFAPPVIQLDENGVLQKEQIDIKSILSYIARDAIDLIGTNARDKLRECANPKCPLLFVDISRPNQRRWCSMDRCGLMEKTSRFRAKAKKKPEIIPKEK